MNPLNPLILVVDRWRRQEQKPLLAVVFEKGKDGCYYGRFVDIQSLAEVCNGNRTMSDSLLQGVINIDKKSLRV